jgi:hypothetical protein
VAFSLEMTTPMALSLVGIVLACSCGKSRQLDYTAIQAVRKQGHDHLLHHLPERLGNTLRDSSHPRHSTRVAPGIYPCRLLACVASALETRHLPGRNKRHDGHSPVDRGSHLGLVRCGVHGDFRLRGCTVGGRRAVSGIARLVATVENIRGVVPMDVFRVLVL